MSDLYVKISKTLQVGMSPSIVIQFMEVHSQQYCMYFISRTAAVIEVEIYLQDFT